MLSNYLSFGFPIKSAMVAYIHYLGIILCVGTLFFERILLKANLNRKDSILLIITDSIYGFAGLAILFTGILRVKYFGQGGDFYTSNPVFWIKVTIFIIIGLISLYPTVTYISWVLPIRKNKSIMISENVVKRFKFLITTELIGFAIIPFFATLMARGVGLN